ncbi:sensor histidine kinase [Cryptosporangium phraense]|uniref:histidine kinase n=1 Tax=Cryptosporangium phraense TaxID=2593070 RepID=A0A545ARU1_9ACTN|nr:sensor histidine kinase [Cryptosporangium phraense]TQS44054.1 hypothetical protein FL583_16510 [Cryptosporangium phraense]
MGALDLRNAAARLAVGGSAVFGAAALLLTLAWHPTPLTVASGLIAATFVPVALVGAAAVRARHGLGWVLLASGVCLPLATGAYRWASAGFATGAPWAQWAPWAGWLDGWPWVPGVALIPTVGLLLFPTGRLPSRWWWPVLVADVGVLVSLTIWTVFGTELIDFPGHANPTALPGAAGAVAEAFVVAIVLVAPLSTLSAIAVTLRYRARRDPAIGLVLPAAWACAAAWWACIVFVSVGGDGADVYAAPLESGGMLAVAITCWIAIRRYGLLDVRTVVGRAAVYAGLTIVVVLVYVGVAAVVGTVAEPAAGPLAVGIAVLVALPGRQLLQHVVNRLVFGYRDDPGGALRRLGERLAGAADAAQMLSGAAQVVRDVLRLQHVAVEVHGRRVAEAGRRPTAAVADPDGNSDGSPDGNSDGSPDGNSDGNSDADEVLELPLVFAGEAIGRLRITSGPERHLTLSERELLTEVSRQVASVAHAVRLGEELSRSRERLVAATEEERRRLRNDLHDGLGPALAGVALGLHRARGKVAADPDAASAQLEQLTAQVRDAVDDVRRLVYGLRPPALDELGLVAAIGEHARALGDVRVVGTVDGDLPAAVEVAAYRIALEAMTNALRHSGARTCRVSLELNGALHVVVEDEGAGLPDGYRAGIGITSMRERAAELGGALTLSRREPSGTTVRAVLPVGGPP